MTQLVPAFLETTILKQRIPLDVTLEVTWRCNQSCGHCYLAGDCLEMETDQIRCVLEKLKHAGCLFLTVTGGEPMLRPDLLDLLDLATDLGMAVTLKTNATLIDTNAAQRISRLGLQDVHVSLLGADADSHDTMTGLPGSFDRACRAITELTGRGVRVRVMSVITRGRANDVPALLALSSNLGVPAACHTMSAFLFPKNNADPSPLKYRMDDSELTCFYRLSTSLGTTGDTEKIPDAGQKAAAPETEGFPQCRTGQAGFTMQPDGSVIPCQAIPVVIGSILTQPADRIPWSAEAGRVADRLCPGPNHPCRGCTRIDTCFRCPGLAFLETGSLITPSIESCRHARILTEVLHGKREKTRT